jgi:cytochrome c oxidase assembly protein subunit 15
VPLLYFIFTGTIARRHWPQLALIFVAGGVQGALGWYMVSSGLVDRVDVSQYRLAAHLTLAFAIFASVLWVNFSLTTQPRQQPLPGRAMAFVFVVLLFLQVAAGGFVAGLDAGHASDSWPKMAGAWIPDGLATLQPLWRNWFDNALAVQFNHRLMAYVLLLLALVQALRVRQASALWLLSAVVAQLAAGILTVLLQVPLSVALIHQGGALAVLALAVWHVAALSRAPVPDRR